MTRKIITPIVIILIIAGIYFLSQNKTQNPEPIKTTEAGTLLAGTATPLYDFTQAQYDEALKSGKTILLYFYAKWCPICREETANALYPAFNQLNTDKLVGFRVNFKDDDTDENEVALARKFGVLYQHTKVILKPDSSSQKFPDSWNLARYLSEIANVLK